MRTLTVFLYLQCFSLVLHTNRIYSSGHFSHTGAWAFVCERDVCVVSRWSGTWRLWNLCWRVFQETGGGECQVRVKHVTHTPRCTLMRPKRSAKDEKTGGITVSQKGKYIVWVYIFVLYAVSLCGLFKWRFSKRTEPRADWKLQVSPGPEKPRALHLPLLSFTFYVCGDGFPFTHLYAPFFFLGADGDLRGCLVLWSAIFGCSTCSGFIALQNYWKSGHARAAEIRKLQLLCARTKLNWFCIKLAIPQQNLHSLACHVRILCICCRLYFKHIRQIANRYKFRSDSFCYANYRATVIRNTCGQSAMARTKCQGLAG